MARGAVAEREAVGLIGLESLRRGQVRTGAAPAAAGYSI